MAVAAEAARAARRTRRSIAVTNTPPPISASRTTIEPDNTALRARANKRSCELLAQRQADDPVTLGAEKAANLFLRADVPAVAAAVGLAGHPPAEVFAEIRARKNKF